MGLLSPFQFKLPQLRVSAVLPAGALSPMKCEGGMTCTSHTDHSVALNSPLWPTALLLFGGLGSQRSLSCVFWGTAGLPSGTPGSASLPTGAQCPYDFLGFWPRDNTGLRPRWVVCWRPRRPGEEKVRKIEQFGERLREWLLFSHDPEGLGVESWVFSQFCVQRRWCLSSFFSTWCPVFPALFIVGTVLPLGESLAPLS